jgi:hypothetical protein
MFICTTSTPLFYKRQIIFECGGRDRLCGLVVRVPAYRTEIYCFSCEVRTQYIYIYMLPPLWSSGQSFWLQIQRFGFDSRRYQLF